MVSTTTDTIDVPVLITIPAKFSKAAQTGVVIFQHGITNNRGALLGIADALGESGLVGVAIDLPLHGITPDDGVPLSLLYDATHERTFNLDIADNASGAVNGIGDGTVDKSGTSFIWLNNLLVTRDNVQQAVADLMALRKAIGSMDYDVNDDPTNNTGADFSGKPVYFIGHSLGAIVGIPFFALDSTVDTAVFAMPGGALPKLLDGSQAFGPTIAAGLSVAGLSKGSADYEGFMLAAQTVLDIIDPINFTLQLSSDSRGILGMSVHNDTVVPNYVPDITSPSGTVAAPLAGTNPLFTNMGLDPLESTTINTTPLHAWVEFGESKDAGTGVCQDAVTPTSVIHQTFIIDNGSTEGVASRTEMQHEVRAFLETVGKDLNVADSSYVCTH